MCVRSPVELASHRSAQSSLCSDILLYIGIILYMDYVRTHVLCAIFAEFVCPPLSSVRPPNRSTNTYTAKFQEFFPSTSTMLTMPLKMHHRVAVACSPTRQHLLHTIDSHNNAPGHGACGRVEHTQPRPAALRTF